MHAAESLRREASAHLLFALAFAIAALLGRATIVDGGSLSLVWPAAGVAALWFVWASGGGSASLAAAALGLGATIAGVNLASGAPAGLSLVFVLANLAQSLAGSVLLTRFLDLGRTVRRSPFSSVRGSVVLLAAGAASSVLGATVGGVGMALTTGRDVDPALVALWWGRNVMGFVVVVATGHLLLTASRHATSGWPRSLLQARWQRSLETAALLLASVAGFVVFAQNGRAFVALLGLTLWVAVRYEPLVVGLYTTVSGAAIVTLTLSGAGPFAEVESLRERAIDVQMLVATLTMMGLVLAGNVADQRRLVARAAAAEREARSRAALFTAVVQSLDDGVVVVDAAGEVVTANDAARHLMEAIPARVGRTGTASVRYPDGRRVPGAELPSAQAMRDGYAAPRDLVVQVEGRRARVLSVSATRLADLGPSGTGAGAALVYRDVTSERADRDELAGFAGAVAHDLRGPLTAVRGWIELSQVAVPPGADLEMFLGRAYSATEGMAALIGDLLTHASRTGPDLSLVEVDLALVVGQAAALAGVEDLVQVAELPPALVDEVLVRQLFVNLIGNAVKYVAPGVVPEVVVEGALVDQDVTVTVTDNGIGVPEADREAVFEKFHRSHPERSDIEGTGLGLAACRMVVERHGGRITVEPGPGGRGSRFRLTLPAATRRPAAATSSR